MWYFGARGEPGGVVAALLYLPRCHPLSFPHTPWGDPGNMGVCSLYGWPRMPCAGSACVSRTESYKKGMVHGWNGPVN